MANMDVLMPVFGRGGGLWSGTYRHFDTDGLLLDAHDVTCLSEYPSDGSCDDRLSTHNRWEDGRETRAQHRANYRDGRLWWDGALTGRIKEVDDETLYLRFGFAVYQWRSGRDLRWRSGDRRLNLAEAASALRRFHAISKTLLRHRPRHQQS